MQGRRLTEYEQRQIVRAAAVMPIRKTARELGYGRNTVRKYIKQAKEKK